MKSKFKKLMAAALVLCLMLALLPAGVLADGVEFTYFDIKQYKEVQANGFKGGTVIVSDLLADGNYTLTVKADENYGIKHAQLKYEKDDGTVTDIIPIDNVAELTYDIDPEKTTTTTIQVQVGFKELYTVNTSGITGGTVTATPTTAFEGDPITLEVAADENYEYVEDSLKVTYGEGTEVEVTGNTFKMPNGNVTVSAQFKENETPPEPVKYNITTAQSNYGAIKADKYKAAEGETVNVTVTPNQDYVVSEVYYTNYTEAVKVPLTGSNGSYTFVMPDYDVEIHAEYTYAPPAPTTYTVTTNNPSGGRIWADKTSGLEYRDWVTVTIDPDDGCWLESLTKNGEDVTDEISWKWSDWYGEYRGTYTFRIREDTKLVATFTSYDDIACIYDGRYGNVTVKVWDGYSRKFVTTNKADKGDLVAVIVEPNSGYMLDDLSIRERWSRDSVSYDASDDYAGVYYFRMPAEDVNIYVDFVEALSDHKVYVDKATDGTLKVSADWAREGQLVYITAVPDKGYELTWLSVKAEDGTKIDVYEALKEDTYYFFMPDQAVTVSAIFAYDYPDMPFTDVNSNSWYFNAVEFVYNKGIMQGVSSTKFGPNGTVTRGMLVTMLWRMAGEPYVGGGSFDDVASGSYYATAVAWAAKNGIVDGYNSTRFGPNDAVTREQIATMLYRYAKWLGYSTSGSNLAGYSDASSVSSWAKDAMGWAVKNSVVTGVTATKLNPTSSATRAETAQMFMNFYEYLN